MFKTKSGREIAVEQLAWDEVSELIQKLSPDLAEAMGAAPSIFADVFYKASYPFGAKIIRGAEVYLPLKSGGTIAINDPELPQQLIGDLAYDPASSNPLAMILDKNCEFFLPGNEHIMSYMVISPGDMFGLSRILDNVTRKNPTLPSTLSFSNYNLNAGVRSLFMLTKISDKIGHNKLKKEYGLSIDTPKNYTEHFKVFKEIAQKAESPWRTEILFFSNKWINKLRDKDWSFLFGQLSQKYRNSHTIWHNIQGWESTCSKIEAAKYLEYFSAYTLDSAKHLFTIAANSAPAYRPATDESSAPIKLIQEAYVKHYGLTEYWPIIMEPAQFLPSLTEPLYYSLSYATLPQFNPQKFKGKTIIALLDEVQRCAEVYQAGILSGNYSQPASLYNAAARVKFSCYHSDPRDYSNIGNSHLIVQEDKRFVFDEPGIFPSPSSFLVGCIKLDPVLNLNLAEED